MKEKDSSPVGVGVITVFMVLIVLGLFTFAALTYSSARADYRLSRINADTVEAYYEADARGAELAAAFVSGTGDELEQYLPMTDTQLLYIHLVRNADGSVSALAWKTVPADDGSDWGNEHLGVWDGN